MEFAEDGLVFTVSYADFEEPGDNGKNNTSHEVFPEYEAAQVERITDATLCCNEIAEVA